MLKFLSSGRYECPKIKTCDYDQSFLIVMSESYNNFIIVSASSIL